MLVEGAEHADEHHDHEDAPEEQEQPGGQQPSGEEPEGEDLEEQRWRVPVCHGTEGNPAPDGNYTACWRSWVSVTSRSSASTASASALVTDASCPNALATTALSVPVMA